AVLDNTTNGAQLVEPSAPLQANALLVVTGTVIAPPSLVVVAAPHGQWPMAPLRSTTRVSVTRVEHNAEVGIANSDLTLQGNAEQFYGDGTQVFPMKPPFGAWGGLGGLRTTQRTGFVWEPHDTAGPANDLLTVPLGQTYQFFGIPDLAGVIPAQGTAIQANAVLSETSGIVVEPVAPLIAQAVLSASVASVTTPSAPVIANAALVESMAQVVEPAAPLTANAALVETQAALIASTAPLQANAALAQTVAILVALSAILQANALLVATGSSITGGGSQPVPVGGSLLAATTPGGALTSSTTPGGSESASATQPASGTLTIVPI
ncbi:MAG TPA: hypothetical protein VGR57_12180, partial [Ktedonobacterales bacterium]|nr:hypothetical protein [Ktedonobacterales bacterium]